MIRYRRAKSEAAGPQGPTHYAWQAPGRTAPIHLSFQVMERLEADVMEGYRSVPKRGAEVGGVLLGRIGEDGETVHIDDYEPVPCEYRRGPSYMLSEADRRRMEKALRKAGAGRQIVGFYRSHTRLGLYLDEQDYSLIQSYFSSPQHVFLLVRPQPDQPCTAGFFFWEDGHIHRQSPYREFPFQRAQLAPAAEAPSEAVLPVATVVAAKAVAPAPVAEPVAAYAPEPVPIARRHVRLRWAVDRRSLGIAALVLVSFGVLEYAALELFSPSRDTAALAASTPALRVERNGNYLQVTWNRNAPAVAHARRGVLSISDGLSRQDLELDPGQLRTGTVAYFATTNDVSFRLQLQGVTEVTESLRVVTPPSREEVARPPVVVPAPEPVRKAQVKRPQPPRRYFYDDGL